jgi:hypothetical protein
LFGSAEQQETEPCGSEHGSRQQTDQDGSPIAATIPAAITTAIESAVFRAAALSHRSRST